MLTSLPMKLASSLRRLNLFSRFLLAIAFLQLLALFHSYHPIQPITKTISIAASHFDTSTASLTYQRLLSPTNKDNKLLTSNSLKEKCDVYFDELYKADPEWNIKQIKNKFQLDVFDEGRFYSEKFEQISKDYAKDSKKLDQAAVMKIFESYKTKQGENEQVQHDLKNSVGHLRIYGSCYVKNTFKEHSRCLDIESRLFPWMTFEAPVFERWDGTSITGFPEITDFYKYEGAGDSKSRKAKKNTMTSETCFLDSLANEFQGKGIVLSMADFLLDDAVNLVKSLRFLRNELPIQFVHKGDLSYESKQQLRDVCRNTLHLENSMTLDFAPQECWFVDAKRCIQEKNLDDFDHWANKWIAVLFNSFEDMIFMDSDAIPFIKPIDFFKLGNYEKKGAYFFKDRILENKIPGPVLNLQLQLFPTAAETSIFGIQQVGDHTLQNRFFSHSMKHLMESGVVLMNRKKKFLGLLTAVHIQFWAPINQQIHGEKEMFWLGQSIVGDEEYEFNPHSAAAVGVIQPETADAPEHVIGTQPAHIAPDNRTLLWINSGAKNCKFTTFEDDFENCPLRKNKFGSKENLRNFYKSPIDIRGAVIPPETLVAWPNEEKHPERGWKLRKDLGCLGYFYSAYSKVGGPLVKDEETFGQVIRFDPDKISHYNMLLKAWDSPVKKT